MDATVATLGLVDWQVFGTGTWRPSCLGSVRSREERLWDFLRSWTEEKRSVKLFDLPVVVRWEKGELGGHPHCHFLLAGLERVSIDWMFKGAARWFELCGLSRIRPFGSTLGGQVTTVRYCLNSISSRKDGYELGKFGSADRLVINDAAWRVICRRSGVEHAPQLRTA